MDHDVVDRIRSASFPLARKGYEKREVDRFLDDLADWLETGGDDIARSDSVRRELERIGEQTTAILTEAHDAAETMRTDADRQVRQQLADANMRAEAMRGSAEDYAEEVREEVDAYARRIRGEADASAERARIEAESAFEAERAEADDYAARRRSEAEERAREVVSEAEHRARQLVEEAQRRRADIESVISDLDQRRKTVVGELRRLAEVAGAAGTFDRGVEPAEAEERGSDREADDESESTGAEAPDPQAVRTQPLPVRPGRRLGEPPARRDAG